MYFRQFISPPRDMFLKPSSCFTEELPIFSLLQKWHEQGKKGKKACFSSPTPRTLPGADHELYFLCNGYCLDPGIHRTPQVNRDHFTSLFFITQIQNSPDSWRLFTLNSSPCLFRIERTQLRDRGSPEPLERLLHLNVVELYHPLRQEGTGSFQALTRSRTQLLPVLLPQYLQAESLGRFSQAR